MRPLWKVNLNMLDIIFKFGVLIFCLSHSPCVSKPIKQRVEAFEKLQTPQKETRTKARVGNTETDVSCMTIALLSIHISQSTEHFYIKLIEICKGTSKWCEASGFIIIRFNGPSSTNEFGHSTKYNETYFGESDERRRDPQEKSGILLSISPNVHQFNYCFRHSNIKIYC